MKVQRQPSAPTLMPIDSSRQRFWRRLVFHAVAEAKRTRCGVPTDSAILERWWIEHQPTAADKDEYERSFNHACEQMGRDPDKMRKKFLEQIEASNLADFKLHVQSVMYLRRAMVLACAGVPTAIARQYAMPLCDEQDYEHVAGIDYGDQYAMYDQRETPAA